MPEILGCHASHAIDCELGECRVVDRRGLDEESPGGITVIFDNTGKKFVAVADAAVDTPHLTELQSFVASTFLVVHPSRSLFGLIERNSDWTPMAQSGRQSVRAWWVCLIKRTRRIAAAYGCS